MTRTQTVSLVVLVLCLTAGCSRHAPESGPLTLVVEASCPGASAQVVAETVAAPLEQQVNGAENMQDMISRCSSGTYVLTVAFKPGTNLNVAQALVQNRVALALKILPEAVKTEGVTVRKKVPGVLMIAALSSPDNRYDFNYLTNYATIQIVDELARTVGVGDIRLANDKGYALRISLDLSRLGARDLTPLDVVRALENKYGKAAPGKQGKADTKEFQFSIEGGGRLERPEEIGNFVLKTSPGDQTIWLKDVAHVELGGGQAGMSRLNGQPAALLLLYPLPQADILEVSAGLRKQLNELRDRLPEGLRLDVPFDLGSLGSTGPRAAADPYLMLDVTLPDNATLQRTEGVLSRCSQVLRAQADVKDVLELSGPPLEPFSNQGCFLVRVAPEKSQADQQAIKSRIRGQLEKEITDATIRLRDFTPPGRHPLGSYPIDLAVHGPELDQVRKLAKKLAERLGSSQKLTDVAICRAVLPAPQLRLDVNREQAAKAGVQMADVLETAEVCLGEQRITDFNRFGRKFPVLVQVGPRAREQIESIRHVKVRSASGTMVPLSTFTTIRSIDSPQVLDRYNMDPMIELSANPAAGVPLEQARKLCESLGDEVRNQLHLPAAYRLSWLAP